MDLKIVSKQKTRVLIVSKAGYCLLPNFLKHVTGGEGGIRLHRRRPPIRLQANRFESPTRAVLTNLRQ